MGNFYDQDNPRASLAKREVSKSVQGINENNNYNSYGLARQESMNMTDVYLRRAEIAKRNSTIKSAKNERIRVIKQQRKRQEMNQRLAALGLACVMIGGVASSIVSSVVEKFEEQAAIYSVVSTFRRDVIEPNTHRTISGNAFYYDYDDIAEAVFDNDKDSAVELYKAYSTLGRNYTNELLEEASYSSLENYVRRCGYDSIRDWEKYSNEAILVEAQIMEKQAELNAMHDEYVGNRSSTMLSNRVTGGSK